MLKVTLSGNQPYEQLQHVVEMVEHRHPGEMEIHVKRARLCESVTVSEAAGIVSGLAALCSLLLQIRKEIADWQDARTWSAERLRQSIDNEMARLGVVHFRVDAVTGFDAILSRTGKFCSVEVTDTTDGRFYKIYISIDGDTHSIEID